MKIRLTEKTCPRGFKSEPLKKQQKCLTISGMRSIEKSTGCNSVGEANGRTSKLEVPAKIELSQLNM